MDTKKEIKGFLQEAAKALKTKAPRDAVKFCKEALKLDKTCYDALLIIGKAAFTMGEHAQAEAAYRKAIEANGTALTAWQGLAELFFTTSSPDKLLDACGEALARVTGTAATDAARRHELAFKQCCARHALYLRGGGEGAASTEADVGAAWGDFILADAAGAASSDTAELPAGDGTSSSGASSSSLHVLPSHQARVAASCLADVLWTRLGMEVTAESVARAKKLRKGNKEAPGGGGGGGTGGGGSRCSVGDLARESGRLPVGSARQGVTCGGTYRVTAEAATTAGAPDASSSTLVPFQRVQDVVRTGELPFKVDCLLAALVSWDEASSASTDASDGAAKDGAPGGMAAEILAGATARHWERRVTWKLHQLASRPHDPDLLREATTLALKAAARPAPSRAMLETLLLLADCDPGPETLVSVTMPAGFGSTGNSDIPYVGIVCTCY
eukprot:jgi/Mesvir1/14121/Mv07027-RA.1